MILILKTIITRLLALCFLASSARGACGDGVLEPDLEACDDGNRWDGDGCSADCLDLDAPTPPCALHTEPFVDSALEFAAFVSPERLLAVTSTRIAVVDAATLAPLAFRPRVFEGAITAGAWDEASGWGWLLVDGRDLWRMGPEGDAQAWWALPFNGTGLFVVDAQQALLLLHAPGRLWVVDAPRRLARALPAPQPIARAQVAPPAARPDVYALRCAAADGTSFAFAAVPVANATDPSTMLLATNWSTQPQTLAQAYDPQRPWHTPWGLADADVSASAVYVPMREPPLPDGAQRWQGVGDPRLRFAAAPAAAYDVLLPNPYDATADGDAPTRVLRHPRTGALWLVRGTRIAEVGLRGVWGFNATLQRCLPAQAGLDNLTLADIRFAVVGARLGEPPPEAFADLGFACAPAPGNATECVLLGTRYAPALFRALAARVRNASAFLMRPYAVAAREAPGAGSMTMWWVVGASALLLVLCMVVCAWIREANAHAYRRVRH